MYHFDQAIFALACGEAGSIEVGSKMRSLVAAVFFAFTTTGVAAQDLAAGERAFARCKACHADVDEHRVGPSLATVMGRKAGSVEGFAFSPIVSEAGESGLVWSAESVDAYLEGPRDFFGGRHRCMAPPMRSQADRDNLVGYLTDLPRIALANRIERDIAEETRLKEQELRAQEEALKTYLAQLEKAKEALLLGAGPGSLDTSGYLRPRLMLQVYEGRFNSVQDDEYPVEYLYRFAEISAGVCESQVLKAALLRYGGNLVGLALEPGFQEDVLSQALENVGRLFGNPGGALASVAEKEAAMNAGIEDGARFAETHACENDSGVARRMTLNLAAILSGEAPVYTDNPIEPDFAAEAVSK